MKKALAILIGMLLILSSVCVVAAAETTVPDFVITPSTSNSTVTDVVFRINQGYTVTIPGQISLASDSGSGYEGIKVDIAQIEVNKYLNIVISAPEIGYYNETSNKWLMKLVGSDNDEDSIEYIIGVGRTASDHVSLVDDSSPIRDEPDYNCVMSVNSTQKDPHEVQVHCKIPEFSASSIDAYAGKYNGKLTFTVDISETALARNCGYVFEEYGFYAKGGSELIPYTSTQSA